MTRWLLKSEPRVFGYDDLVRVEREGWDGVRNFQARNYMREMKVGDRAIFYHSNAKPPGAAGVCKILKRAEPDPTQFDPASKYYDPDVGSGRPALGLGDGGPRQAPAVRAVGRIEVDAGARRMPLACSR